MIPDKKVANAVGAKTARACDSCIKRRARWYCAADDAFLCQACDSSVHSANPLARRHERVRLKTSSSCSKPSTSNGKLAVSWHRGFTKKARTPRHGKAKNPLSRKAVVLPLVPEIGADDATSLSYEENEEEQTLLYRVPVYNPEFMVDEQKSGKSNVGEMNGGDGPKGEVLSSGSGNSNGEVDGFHGFLQSEMDLADFAADVESLLGKGFENESNFAMEELGLVDYDKAIKIEEKEIIINEHDECENIDHDHDGMEKNDEPFQLNFDYYDDPSTCTGEDGCRQVIKEEVGMENSSIAGGFEGEEEDMKKKKKKREILLRLDYEAVITAWASQGSPWTTGDRPNLDLDPVECLPDSMSGCGTGMVHNPYVEMGGIGIGIGSGTPHIGTMGGGHGGGDRGREARVSRYREKRRTRLFSKKIRYEVRKLNAEKRPRMKGRFVKRTSIHPPPPFPLFHNQTTTAC